MSERGQMRLLRNLVITLLVVGLPGWVAFYWFQTTINSSAIAAKCQQRIEQTVDPVALQAWATNLLQSHSPSRTNYLGPFEPPENLKGIWNRGTPSVYIQSAAGGGNEDHVYVFGAAVAQDIGVYQSVRPHSFRTSRKGAAKFGNRGFTSGLISID